MVEWTLVAVIVFATLVLYCVERYTRQKTIDLADAVKLSTLSGVLTGGVLYAVDGGDGVTSVAAEVLSSAVDTAQDMFVGKPSF
jgi:hypothetical protein